MSLGRQVLNPLLSLAVGSTPVGISDVDLVRAVAQHHSSSGYNLQLTQAEIEALAPSFAVEKNYFEETIVQEGRGIRTTANLTQRYLTQEEKDAIGKEIPEGYNALAIRMAGNYKQEYNPQTGEGQGVLTVGFTPNQISVENPYQTIFRYDENYKDAQEPVIVGILYQNADSGTVVTVLMPSNTQGFLSITTGRIDGTNPNIFTQPLYTGENGMVTTADFDLVQE